MRWIRLQIAACSAAQAEAGGVTLAGTRAMRACGALIVARAAVVAVGAERRACVGVCAERLTKGRALARAKGANLRCRALDIAGAAIGGVTLHVHALPRRSAVYLTGRRALASAVGANLARVALVAAGPTVLRIAQSV